MAPIPKENLSATLRLNQAILHRHTQDLTQADSLVQPPFQANCMNWVLGHILANRDTILNFLGLEKSLSSGEHQLYHRGSERLTDADLASDLPQLLARLEKTKEQILLALETIEPAGLDKTVHFGEDTPLGEVIDFLFWHETYHIGQLELLRQVAGKNDPIIR